MDVVTEPGAARAIVGDRGSVVTIGAYDGVHLGHRAVIDEVRHLAETRGALSAMVTFDRHPATVVRPESAPCRLTSLEQRLELLETTGLDLVLVIRFDEERSHETAEAFVNEVLLDGLRARAIVVGHDFHFGAKRAGNVEMLQRLGAVHDFDVLGMRLVATGDAAVSSTRIRGLLHDGEVVRAAALLGRPHEVRGTVMHGDARGRELGFPTANVAVPDGVCLPADGIYAALYTTPDGVARPAAVSLGRRPTFYVDAKASLLEAYVLDFDGDLYDQPAAVAFVERLRGEQRFDHVDDLIKQMHADVAATRAALGF
ncbi:MAG TPA: bifunctional riboflavin kinase/FAD synthetase [Acidimicrobiales bacterium]|nr:bifunctional riboflavin kinase/FAD synthetase [Acidimicrobiales bacterium]